MKSPDNEAYWVNRHGELQGQLAAIGKIGMSQEHNLMAYARKKRRLADLLRALDRLDLAGKSVLDAGCGVGMMTELLYALGAEVSGVDASPIAAEEARMRCSGGNFKVGSLVDFEFEEQFDMTFAIDVLYHVVDDDNWRIVMANLVAHTKIGGFLVLVDQHRKGPDRPAPHVRFRTEEMYREILSHMEAHECTPTGHDEFLVYRVNMTPVTTTT